MDTVTLVLERDAEKSGDGRVIVRRDDLRALSAVLDALDNGRMKRGLVRSVDRFAEEVYQMESKQWGSLMDDGRLKGTLEVTPEVLETIKNLMTDPPQEVKLPGRQFAKLRMLLEDTHEVYEKRDEEAKTTETGPDTPAAGTVGNSHNGKAPGVADFTEAPPAAAPV